MWRMACAALACAVCCGLVACESNGTAAAVFSEQVDLRSSALQNRMAYIPPQCFTRVSDAAGSAQNPCYVCHAEARAPNMLSQPEVQLVYAFPQLRAGTHVQNPWTNLFRDRRSQIAAIDDAAVSGYVAQDNYGYGAARNLLAQRLAAAPRDWDVDGNGHWDGYVPDAHYHFDARGFDRAPDGEPSGYRVFAYYPLPGGFMPANGSFDDVLIRLPPAFRTAGAGEIDLHVYELNLAIVEALIRRQDVAIDATDERSYGIDLDGDGALAEATHVHYAKTGLQYVGQAGVLQAQGNLHLAPGLFPEGTEFLHSVRYLAVDASGKVSAAPRMKELRYARKQHWRSYAQLQDHAQREAKEAALNPDRPELFSGDAERGVHNASGWVLQGFIEDRSGQLRPQAYEETVFCMGCHGGLSATEDSMFAFARKLTTGPAHGYHVQRLANTASTANGTPLQDPLREDGLPEYTTYLQNNHAGDSYRSNDEVLTRFFDSAGDARSEAFQQLAQDISTLLLPSAKRALALDKAYWLIVREQSFRSGRDPVLAPLSRVLRDVQPDAPTGITHAELAPRLRAELTPAARGQVGSPLPQLPLGAAMAGPSALRSSRDKSDP